VSRWTLFKPELLIQQQVPGQGGASGGGGGSGGAGGPQGSASTTMGPATTTLMIPESINQLLQILPSAQQYSGK
jgi:hypothetical protein